MISISYLAIDHLLLKFIVTLVFECMQGSILLAISINLC